MKGLVVAGTHSGSGKTTIALGLMAALRRRQWRIAPFKVGPDFIDPGHHSRICGKTSRNLDGWMLSRQYNQDCFRHHAFNADMAVVEGVMGLFDGFDGSSEAGSTAQMAKWLRLPVLLVVDARSMARSAAALVQGFENFDPELVFAGVVFNQIGSPRHFDYLRQAVADHLRMPCLGGVLREPQIAIPERHLGLMTQMDHAFSNATVDRLADLVERGVDLDGVISAAGEWDASASPQPSSASSRPRVRIGVAMDNAFCFYYQDNLDLLAAAGAQLVYFSPIADPTVPDDLDGLYFGGGYPELFAAQLASNEALRRQIHNLSRQGMPVYAECGGLMYLGRSIVGLEGRRFQMTGCFPLETRMLTRLKSLGYREIELKAETPLGPAGLRLRGHEFHYSEITEIDSQIDRTYRVSRGNGSFHTEEGYRAKRTLGSYFHLHFGSRPECARHFVQNCAIYRQERKSHP